MRMKKTVLLSFLIALVSVALAAADVYTMYDPSYVYTRNGNNLVWLATIDAGYCFDSISEEFVPEKVSGGANTKKNVFAKVSYKGQEAWIIKSGLLETDYLKRVQGAGVITEDCAVYTWNNRATFENVELPAGTVILIDSEEASYQTGLKKIYFFDDQVFWTIRSAYILSTKYSADSDDYDAVVITKTALRKDVKKEMEIITKLLSSAEGKARDAKIVKYVKDALDKVEGNDISKSPVSPVRGISTGTINSDGSKVNVRETPGKNGKIVGHLNDGTRIDISEYTEMKETIAGEESSWYKVSCGGEDSVEGWIFGSAIKWDEP